MNENVQEYLSNAGIAFMSGQHEAALELCEKAIAEEPDCADAYTGAGKACLVLERFEESEQYLQKAVELDSQNGERYFDLANIKFGLEKFTEALQNYAKAEQMGCNDVVLQKLYYQVGILGHISGDTKAALMNFEKADSLGVINEDTKDMLIKRLQIYIELEDYAQAENYAIQLKMLAPNEFRSYQIYFQVLVANGKYAQAENVLAEAEKYSEDIGADILNQSDMCFNRAMLHAAKGENAEENPAQHYKAAIKVFDDFLVTPDLPQDIVANICIAKAEMHLKIDEFDEAIACVDSIQIDDEIESDDVAAKEDGTTGAAEEQSPQEELREKIDFLKLTSYLGKEDYETAENYALGLITSPNEQYSYFATYADAFIAQKFAGKDAEKAKTAENKYNNAIAFFKQKAFENPLDLFAVVFRTRLYAENGKFVMADELIKFMPEALKGDLSDYVADCRAELEKKRA